MSTKTVTFAILFSTLAQCAFSEGGATIFAEHFHLSLPATYPTRTIPAEWMEVGTPVTIGSLTGLVSRIETNNKFLPSLIQLSALKLFPSAGCIDATICQFPSQETAYQSAINGISETSMNSEELLAHYSYETNFPDICLCWHDQKDDLDGTTISLAVIVRGNIAGFFTGISGTNLPNVASAVMNSTSSSQPLFGQ